MLKTQSNITIDENGQRWVNDFYMYIVNAGTLAANGVFSGFIAIEADSSFILVKLGYSCDLAGALQTDSSRVIPLVTVGITDSGSGRNLQNAQVPIGLLAGHDGLPFVLPVAREFKPSSSIQVNFTNTSANVYNNVKLVMFGIKRFKL